MDQVNNVYKYLNNDLKFKLDEIIYSPLSRAYDTALPFFEINTTKTLSSNWAEYNYKKDQHIVDKEGNVWVYKKENASEFKNRILNEFKILIEQGNIEKRKQTLVFTHSQVISTILSCGLIDINSNIIKLDHDDEYLKTFFHLSNCSITCIDIDEDRQCHVQAVNYTKHLNTCTGEHSPFI